jgi:hypothetical protein
MMRNPRRSVNIKGIFQDSKTPERKLETLHPMLQNRKLQPRFIHTHPDSMATLTRLFLFLFFKT